MQQNCCVDTLILNAIECFAPQRFGFENRGTEASDDSISEAQITPYQDDLLWGVFKKKVSGDRVSALWVC